MTNDPWLVAEMEVEGLPFLIRMREMVPSSVSRADFPILVSIVWSYDATESGLPSAETHDLMGQFEERLDALEDAGVAYVMVTTTTAGEKDWYWYASSAEVFIQHFNEALAGFEALPLEIEASEDPEWESYASFLQAAATD